MRSTNTKGLFLVFRWSLSLGFPPRMFNLFLFIFLFGGSRQRSSHLPLVYEIRELMIVVNEFGRWHEEDRPSSTILEFKGKCII